MFAEAPESVVVVEPVEPSVEAVELPPPPIELRIDAIPDCAAATAPPELAELSVAISHLSEIRPLPSDKVTGSSVSGS